jgi:integrase
MAEIAKNVQAIRGLKPSSKRYNKRVRGERGLLVAVHPTGRKVYFVRFQVGRGSGRQEKSREIGNFDEIPLAQACTMAAGVRAAVARGEDPFGERLAGYSFAMLFARWLEDYAKRRKRSWAEDERRWRLHLEPQLGRMPITDITRAMLTERLHGVAAQAGPIQANRVGALLSIVFNWSLDMGLVEQTPAFRLPKLGEEGARERFLLPDEIKAFWRGLDGAPITPAMRYALRLMLVTGQRRGEVISMRKADLDLGASMAVWTIPSPASKNKNPHRVPLPPLALLQIGEAIELCAPSEYVFPSPRDTGTHMWESAATKAMGRVVRVLGFAEPAWPHDLRRTVATNMARLKVPRADAERVLNHVKGARSSTFGKHYDQHAYDDEKFAALATWEQELRRILELPMPIGSGSRPLSGRNSAMPEDVAFGDR